MFKYVIFGTFFFSRLVQILVLFIFWYFFNAFLFFYSNSIVIEFKFYSILSYSIFIFGTLFS